MSKNYFDVEDIILSSRKCKEDGKPFMIATEDPDKINKSKNYNCWFIPVLARTVQGSYIPLTLKFSSQILASGAKIPSQQSDNSTPKLQVSYKKLSKEEFENTDYASKPSKIDELLNNNSKFIEALNIIADSYEAVTGVKIVQKYAKKNNKVNSFRQTKRNAQPDDNTEEEYIDLPHPLFRIQFPIDSITKKLGYSIKKKDNEFVPIVFHLKKSLESRKSGGGDVPARIKTSNGYVDIDLNNAKEFITYMSITTGTITFDSIVASQSGISLSSKFKCLYVGRHKKLTSTAINDDLLQSTKDMGVDNSDNEEVYDEPVINNTKNTTKEDLKKQLVFDEDVFSDETKKSSNDNFNTEPEENNDFDDMDDVKKEKDEEVVKETLTEIKDEETFNDENPEEENKHESDVDEPELEEELPKPKSKAKPKVDSETKKSTGPKRSAKEK